ncbi:MAG: hypothetical protein JF591_15075 [Lysobacter sp.]|nr:hypothetical protein [Lysobacter sp.]
MCLRAVHSQPAAIRQQTGILMNETSTFRDTQHDQHPSAQANPAPTDASILLAEALKPGAASSRTALAADALLALTQKGLEGDAACYAQYQSILLDLHVPGEPRTEPTRRWLASQIYQVEDRFAPTLTDFRVLPVDQFRAAVDAEIASRTRVKHPMSLHLFQGTPPLRDVRMFLRHHWNRSYNFYSLLSTSPCASTSPRSIRWKRPTSTTASAASATPTSPGACRWCTRSNRSAASTTCGSTNCCSAWAFPKARASSIACTEPRTRSTPRRCGSSSPSSPTANRSNARSCNR